MMQLLFKTRLLGDFWIKLSYHFVLDCVLPYFKQTDCA